MFTDSTSPQRPQAIVLDPGDDVAVAIVELAAGSVVALGDDLLDVVERIPVGHKIARRDIAAGSDVLKYGEAIGHATSSIGRGTHVHVHNLVGNRLGVES